MFLFPNKLGQHAYANAKSGPNLLFLANSSGSNLNNQWLTILTLMTKWLTFFNLSQNMVK
jgi:hypothetical protein